jgi:O-antigen/teichoic acid export membrane protein
MLKNTILKNSVIYLFSSILNKSIPFLLLPVMTKFLSPSEYGLLSIFLIFINLYSAFIGMNIHANISKNFFKVTKYELSKYIGNIFYILVCTFVFYLLLTFFICLCFDEIFSISSKWFFALPFISIMTMTNQLNITILRNEQRPYIFGFFEIFKTAIIMATTVFCLVVINFGWYSQVIGLMVSGVIFSIIGLWYMYKRGYLTFEFDIEKIKSVLQISVPLIPHVLGGLVIAMSDRFFIEKMVSVEAVGLYAVGYSFGMMLRLFTDAFIKAWSPWFYKNIAEPTEKKKIKIVKYTYLFILCLFVLTVLVAIVANIIMPYFVDEKFLGARIYIFWIALGYAVRGIYQIFFPYLVHINRTSFLAVSSVIAAIVNLLLNYILISIYGAIGAAYATIGAFAISAILVFWYQQKNYYMPWFIR